MIDSHTLLDSFLDDYDTKFSDLQGKTLLSVEKCEDFDGNDMLVFTCNDNTKYIMIHRQDCCESVYVEDICGELEDLVNTEIIKAEMETNDETDEEYKPLSEYDESYTWTFYQLRTHKGDVTIRWYGSSNGYYSESVNFFKLKG